MVKHPLHVAVADAIEGHLDARYEFLRDPACGGKHHLQLFVGPETPRETRMCQVDGLVIEGDRLRVILEVEESDFVPTKICGKFLQAKLSTHYAHPSRLPRTLPTQHGALFLQVLDASKCSADGGSKMSQARLIEQRIRGLLPFRGGTIGDYRLVLVDGPDDHAGLESIGVLLAEALA